MGIGVGIFLIAIGAILTFAVNASSSSVNVDAVGWILMGVGLVSILLSLLFWQSWAGPGYWTRRRTTYVDDGPPPTYELLVVLLPAGLAPGRGRRCAAE